MKSIAIAILAAIVALAPGDDIKKHNYVPDDGYVPNKDVAIMIAVAVWGPIYGEDHIAGEKPYRAKLVEGHWVVEGSLPKGARGGVALAEISKEDGRIVRVGHGK